MTATTVRRRAGRTKWSHLDDIDPTEWEYVGAFDSRDDTPGRYIGEHGEHEFGEGTALYRKVWGTNWLNAYEVGWLGGLLKNGVSLWRDSGQCDHCGAAIRYVVVLHHKPSGDVIATGETCVSERFDFQSKAEQAVHLLRKRAAAASATRATLARRDAYLVEHPEAVHALAWLEEHRAESDFYDSLVKALPKYGEWTERQLAAALAAPGREVERARVQAERDAEVKVPCPEGKVVIEGVVVKVEWKETDFGGKLVQTVKDARGFLVWGTVPQSLQRQTVWDADGSYHDVEGVKVGDRVRFTAAVTRSDRDESFGFYKRPAKAERIDQEVAE